MKIKLTLLLLICTVWLSLRIYAQLPGDIDFTFDPGSGLSGNVYALKLQTDGKLLVAGDFSTYNGVTKKYLLRILSDGQLDTTFNRGSGPNGTVTCLVQQPDGKCIIGGGFILYDGKSQPYIARIHSDGSLDTTFKSKFFKDDENEIIAVALQTDGKILVGGTFIRYGADSMNNILRLNPDGSLDTTYKTGTGFNDYVSELAIQPGGKALVAGLFTDYNGSSIKKFLRLNTNGSLDTTFKMGTGLIGTGINGLVWDIAFQPDGKIIIAGRITNYNGVPIKYIARLYADGILDTAFNKGVGPNADVYSVALQADGKMVIGGGFTRYDGHLENCLTRINPDGSRDTTFFTGAGANNQLSHVALQPDGNIFITGRFTTYKTTPRRYIARVVGGGPTGIISHFSKPIVSIYPNPLGSSIHIDHSNVETSQIQIVNDFGQLLIQINADANLTTINTETLPSGVYFVRLFNRKGEVTYTQKVIK